MDNGSAKEPVPAHILFSQPQPKVEKDVTVTMVSELDDELPPPFDPLAARETPQNLGRMKPLVDYDAPDFRPEQNIEPDMMYRITDRNKPNASAEKSEPKAPAPDFRPEQNIEPEMTYRITDRNKSNASAATSSPKAPAPDSRLEQDTKPDMKHKITDRNKPNASAATSSPKAPAPDFRPEQNIEPDMTYRITDRNKTNASAATSAPTASAPDFRSEKKIEPDMTYRITDRNKPKVPGAAPSQDFRSQQSITPDMTYRITDHPHVKNSEITTAPEKSRNPIKGVIGAGRRKIEQFVDNRKSDNTGKRTSSVEEITDNANSPEEEIPTYASPVNNTEGNASARQYVPAPVEEPAEDIFGKGIRKLPNVSIGKTVEGVPTKLSIDGNITYICGNRSAGRNQIMERILAQIIADTHPDDVELWLFDCGNGEFMKYADNTPAHIKYLVADTGAETSLDFADVIVSEMDRRIEAFAENGWNGFDSVPADVFMPSIVVAVNSFPRFSENMGGTSKYFGRNYNSKLSKLFKDCANYGIHFLLSGSEFSEDGDRPACMEGCVIHSAIVVSGKDLSVHKLFSGIRLYDNEVESLKKIPTGCAFIADENSTDGLTLVRLVGVKAENKHTYKAVLEYSENLEEYLDKHPFIGDRKTASRYDDRSDYREEQLGKRADDEYLLFLGEPCRFMGDYPIRLYDDFGENLLAIAPAREKNSAALTVRAALRSLEEQGVKTEILACRSNPVYTELESCGALKDLPVFEGAKAEKRVREIADKLDNGERWDAFEIVLGGDLLVASMHADDMIGVLKKALVKGPRSGAHFMFISGSAGTTASGFLSLFRHKLVFACPYSEAEKILRDPNCDLPENSFRLSNDYDELTILPYLM